ncbi:hypothetical protein Taro_018070 [Colocasia esculenta]|uniref:Sugar phosphate transporter domain-containing protein n=1 Tax=Colocasia esculenta TaxID=4460 RepID=A0A843V1C4_COLES|nr:hypothetical protein [Colocasia esculenta]
MRVRRVALPPPDWGRLGSGDWGAVEDATQLPNPTDPNPLFPTSLFLYLPSLLPLPSPDAPPPPRRHQNKGKNTRLCTLQRKRRADLPRLLFAVVYKRRRGTSVPCLAGPARYPPTESPPESGSAAFVVFFFEADLRGMESAGGDVEASPFLRQVSLGVMVPFSGVRASGIGNSIVLFFAALSYGITSMAMVFINKAILMQYAYSMTLLTLQQVATALLIHFGRVFGYTKSKEVNLSTAKKLLPVSIFYNANVAFALASLKGVNIPMYIALKRLTPLAVLVAGFFSGKGRPSTQVSLSVIFVALGVIIAALGDFSFDFFGYSMALTSVFFQTMYLVLVEKSGAEDGLSSVELMFYNSLLSIPFLIFLIIATGEFPHSLYLLFEKVCIFSNSSATLPFLCWEFCNSTPFTTLLLPHFCNENDELKSAGPEFGSTKLKFDISHGCGEDGKDALTTTIVGVLKGVGSTTLGFVLLGGVQVHALNVTGLVINTAGGLWYSYAKYRQKKVKQWKVPSDAESRDK